MYGKPLVINFKDSNDTLNDSAMQLLAIQESSVFVTWMDKCVIFYYFLGHIGTIVFLQILSLVLSDFAFLLLMARVTASEKPLARVDRIYLI